MILVLVNRIRITSCSLLTVSIWVFGILMLNRRKSGVITVKDVADGTLLKFVVRDVSTTAISYSLALKIGVGKWIRGIISRES